MKLVVAIVHAADARSVLDGLMAKGYRATKIGTLGGFLVRGNATILIGVEDDKVDAVLEILHQHCHPRKEFVSPVLPAGDTATARSWVNPMQVEVGGTTVFVLNVERFERL